MGRSGFAPPGATRANVVGASLEGKGCGDALQPQ
jgi:hypothetical protein